VISTVILVQPCPSYPGTMLACSSYYIRHKGITDKIYGFGGHFLLVFFTHPQ